MKFFKSLFLIYNIFYCKKKCLETNFFQNKKWKTLPKLLGGIFFCLIYFLLSDIFLNSIKVFNVEEGKDVNSSQKLNLMHNSGSAPPKTPNF